jgi:hypothetical protein
MGNVYRVLVGELEGKRPLGRPWHRLSRSSSGSIVSDYGLDDWGSIPDKGREFFF